ncbi:MAG: MBL fold metallo-hydrolase [Gammaproteobacteria bacterium]|nr:MBL fold metallo-hydrolase [Gammaproteobacteria bacterium]MYE86132.1 MBL fold metallo-hydrolase [Gammaproteobacteria bacterium]
MVNVLKWLGVLLLGIVLGYVLRDTGLSRVIDERRAEAVGTLASSYIASQTELDDRTDVKTVAGLQHIEVGVDQPAADVFRASGVGNTFLIRTAEGLVLFDTGLATQAAKHKRLLQEAAAGEITHIVLSHSHADHIGGTKFWLAEFPDATVVTHARFHEGQRYLKDLERHFWSRNRLLYTFMPEEPPDSGMNVYGGITSDIEVAEGDVYAFTLGGVRFEAIATAGGAEGDDNLVLWLPDQRLLFSGDFFGPLFPMVPNLFTLRGEKFRDPLAYVRSLDKLIALEPEMVLPSHFDPVSGGERIRQDMQRMRDATQFIHDQTVAGMNRGDSLWQLMRDIQLPPELALSQGHGKVSWNVRSIWEHYSTWFHFESTTELYPLQVRELYPDIAELAGGPEPLAARARQSLEAGEPEAALHWIELGLAGQPDHRELLQARLDALNQLLDRAYEQGSNYSETGWLKSRITATEGALAF